MIHRKQFAGTRKAALHFIGNHHNTVFVAQAANGGNQFFFGATLKLPGLNWFKSIAAHRFASRTDQNKRSMASRESCVETSRKSDG